MPLVPLRTINKAVGTAHAGERVNDTLKWVAPLCTHGQTDINIAQ